LSEKIFETLVIGIDVAQCTQKIVSPDLQSIDHSC